MKKFKILITFVSLIWNMAFGFTTVCPEPSTLPPISIEVHQIIPGHSLYWDDTDNGPLTFVEAKWFNQDPSYPSPGYLYCIYSTPNGSLLTLQLFHSPTEPISGTPWGPNWQQVSPSWMVCKQPKVTDCIMAI